MPYLMLCEQACYVLKQHLKFISDNLGFRNRVMCIFGICCTMDKEDSGCQTICGEDTCEDAVDPGLSFIYYDKNSSILFS